MNKKLNQELVQQLRDGKIWAVNDASTEKLNQVLRAAFPKCRKAIGRMIYYFKGSDSHWCAATHITTPLAPVVHISQFFMPSKKNVKDMGPKDAIHCPTEAEAIALCKLMDEAGLRWCTGERYTENSAWSYRGNKMCYFPESGTHAALGYYKGNGYTIHAAADFIPDEPAQATQPETIPFDWEKYKSGGYEVVTRDGRTVRRLSAVDDQSPLYGCIGDDHCSWWPDGRLNLSVDSPADLFLRPIPQPQEQPSDELLDPSKLTFPCELDVWDNGDQIELLTVIGYHEGANSPWVVAESDGGAGIQYYGFKYARLPRIKHISLSEAEKELSGIHGQQVKITK